MQKKKQDKNILKDKQEDHQQQNQHRNRKSETYTMITKIKKQQKKNQQPKMKATWV